MRLTHRTSSSMYPGDKDGPFRFCSRECGDEYVKWYEEKGRALFDFGDLTVEELPTPVAGRCDQNEFCSGQVIVGS